MNGQIGTGPNQMQYLTCQCVHWMTTISEQSTTKKCCDQFENNHVSGVKYSGTYADEVRLPCIPEIEVLICLVVH